MFEKTKVFILLDTFWGERAGRISPRWYNINPNNYSGKKIYKLTGCNFREVMVGNICKYQVGYSNELGKPDLDWVKSNFDMIPKSIRASKPLLIMGSRSR